MKTTSVRFLFVLALATRASQALAIVDFETDAFGNTPIDDSVVAGTFNDSGVQLTFGFDINSDGVVDVVSPPRFEHVGTYQAEGTNIGFQGSDGTDTADLSPPGLTAQLGDWFLRSSTFGAPFGRFVIQYSSPFPVTAASGEVWDIDGQLPDNTGTEQYRVEAFDSSSNSLGFIDSPIGTLTSNLAPLDGKPWVFSFSGLAAGIDHIYVTFIGTKTFGIGLAFNNFHPVSPAVPEPSSAVLGGLVGCAFLWNRRRRAENAGC